MSQLGKNNIYSGNKNIYIADLHSDIKKFKVLWNKLKDIKNLSDYRLIFLGDLFGRGKKTVDLKDFLIKIDQDYNCLYLWGNWDFYLNQKIKYFKNDLRSLETLRSNFELKFLCDLKIKRENPSLHDLYVFWEENNLNYFYKKMQLYFETKKVLATHAPLKANDLKPYYEPYENNRGLLEHLPADFLTMTFIDENNDDIDFIKKIFISGHQTGNNIGTFSKPKVIPRGSPLIKNNRIILDSGGAGIPNQIPIFAYVEDLNIFIGD